MRVALPVALIMCVSAAAGSLAAAPKAASKPTDVRTAAEKLLRSTNVAPGAADLAKVGANVDAGLLAVARDAKIELPVRARAVSALAHTPTPAARQYLERLVTTAPPALPSGPDSELALVRRAALALGWIGGARTCEIVAPLLIHADPDTRADAAAALGLTRQGCAADLLRKRVAFEPDARVRGHVSRQLSVLEAAVGPGVRKRPSDATGTEAATPPPPGAAPSRAAPTHAPPTPAGAARRGDGF